MDMDLYEAAWLAFCEQENLDPDDYNDGDNNGPLYGEGIEYGMIYGHTTYAVLTEDDADRAWEAALDSYLEECVYPELSGSLVHYFNDDAWKRDARYDGRGHSLGHYDGTEHEIQLPDGTWMYIYRTN